MFVHFRVFERTVSVTDEQARWLVGELRTLRPVDVTGAAERAAARIEQGLAAHLREVDEESTDEGVRVLLMALERLIEAPEPLANVQGLHDALATELRRRAV